MRVNDDHSNVQWRMPGVQPQSLALAQPELKRCTCCGATFHVWANRAD